MKKDFKRLFRNVNPAIIIIVVVLLANRMLSSNQSIGDWLFTHVLMLPGIIIGLTFHEAAHGYVSHWLGDPTPKIQGRLTLNPLKHIDPIGFLALILAGFGWGQPVEIDPRYYKHRRRDELLVSVSGVVMNFLIAFLASLGIKMIISSIGIYNLSGIMESVFYMLYYMMTINIMLMIFNLLPVPPLDGFGIITQIFNLTKYSWYWPVYKNGFLILMVLIIFNITDIVFDPAISFFMNLLLG